MNEQQPPASRADLELVARKLEGFAEGLPANEQIALGQILDALSAGAAGTEDVQGYDWYLKIYVPGTSGFSFNLNSIGRTIEPTLVVPIRDGGSSRSDGNVRDHRVRQ